MSSRRLSVLTSHHHNIVIGILEPEKIWEDLRRSEKIWEDLRRSEKCLCGLVWSGGSLCLATDIARHPLQATWGPSLRRPGPSLRRVSAPPDPGLRASPCSLCHSAVSLSLTRDSSIEGLGIKHHRNCRVQLQYDHFKMLNHVKSC